MFPAASATRQPNKNQLYELCPEFLRGTSEYPPATEKKLQALMNELHKALYPVLRNPSKQPLVIVWGEAHNNYFDKLMLINYLKQYQIAHPDLKVAFLQEAFDKKNTFTTALAAFKKEFKAFASGRYNRQLFAKFMHDNCFVASKISQETAMDTARLIIQCTIPAAIAYGFDFKFANTVADLSSKQIEHMKLYSTGSGNDPFSSQVIFYSEPHHTYISEGMIQGPYIIEAIDAPIIKSLKQSINNDNADIIVLATGFLHLKPTIEALKEWDQPYIALTPGPSKQVLESTSRVDDYQKHCFKPLAKCPPEYGKLAWDNYGQKFCLTVQPYDSDDCDKSIHDAATLMRDRTRFARDPKNAVQLSSCLPGQQPKKLSDFFSPINTVNDLKQKFTEVDEETVNTNFSPKEL